VLSPGARARLEAHPWPGNARELRNVLQIALLMRRGNVITEEDLQFRAAPVRKADPPLRMAGMSLERIEREAYRLALERNDGDRRAAMEELGVSRSTFFRKLEEFGLGK
jgi:DNA-binding NtrC family response regulator